MSANSHNSDFKITKKTEGIFDTRICSLQIQVIFTSHSIVKYLDESFKRLKGVNFKQNIKLDQLSKNHKNITSKDSNCFELKQHVNRVTFEDKHDEEQVKYEVIYIFMFS